MSGGLAHPTLDKGCKFRCQTWYWTKANDWRCWTSWVVISTLESWSVSFPSCCCKSCHFSSISAHTGNLCWERNTNVQYYVLSMCKSYKQYWPAPAKQRRHFPVQLHLSGITTVLAPLPQITSPMNILTQWQEKAAYTSERQKLFFSFAQKGLP